MRIGIVPVLNGFGGGVYQYSLAMLRALEAWQDRRAGDACAMFTAEFDSPALSECRDRGWEVHGFRAPPSGSRVWRHRTLEILRHLAGEGLHRNAWRWYRRREGARPTKSDSATPKGGAVTAPIHDLDLIRARPQVGRWFARCGIELMLYPYPDPLSFECGIPYILAIHDLQHRLQPEFPEVSADGMWEKQEYLFRNGAKHATLILVDSEVGKEDVLDCYGAYGVTPERVKVLPFLPSSYLTRDVPAEHRRRVQSVYGLPDRYLFYPAQFWPHKNHARIVRALGLIEKREGLRIPIVFCGARDLEIRERTFREVASLIDQLNLGREVRHLGFVPNEDMSALYAGAEGLVMPTFFGPTNIPVLEAWSFGCPVLTSDIRGIREQVGDAAVLADPRSIESIADQIRRLWTDESLRQTLIQRGRQRLAAYTVADYQERLTVILDEAKSCIHSKKQNRSRWLNRKQAGRRNWWNRSPGAANRLPSLFARS